MSRRMAKGAEHDDLLGDLTPAQQAAASHFEGPLLILAAAGSGKTRVLTRRIAYLLRQGVSPFQILAITFTNKAANEMKQRVNALVPNSPVWISTFHSFGARILRQHAERVGLKRNFTIYDQSDRHRLVKDAIDAAGVDQARFTPERIESAISKAKNQVVSSEKYAASADDFFSQTVAKVYPFYERKLRAANAVDFDDLLYWPAMVMRHDPELRAELDARFRFVLIDEYQDTNLAQYAIAQGLSRDFPNLCVVGDPDQSIYKWRGSDIKIILSFRKDFSNAREITLEKNFRSTKLILRVADHLISHNRQRVPKALVTDNPTGQRVQLLAFETGLDEAEGIALRIRKAVETGGRGYRDHAIFVRINALSRTLESAMVKYRIPFQIVKGLAFFERKENKDVLAYLKLLLNPQDSISFLRIVNEPPRGIGKTSIDRLREYADPRELSLMEAASHAAAVPGLKGKPVRGLLDFVQMMRELQELADHPPEKAVRDVLDKSGYRRMLQESSDAEDQERLSNVEELITAARQYAAEDSTRTLADFLENITLASDVDQWDDKQDCVSIMTLHAAKGLEFPVVYMVAVESGLLPHERALSGPDCESELEEERRLAFVGVTRAREELYLSRSRIREFRGRMLYAITSPFWLEMPDDATEEIDMSSTGGGRSSAIDAWRYGGSAATNAWKEAGVSLVRASDITARATPPSFKEGGYAEGMVVAHEQYGRGRVTEVSGLGVLRKVKVRFSKAGERTFLADKAKLTILKAGE